MFQSYSDYIMESDDFYSQKVFTSKYVGPGPSSYKKRIYRAAVSQRLRNTDLDTKSALTVVT
jgi:hypothetical protein